MSLLEYLEAADEELQTSLRNDLADYLKEIEKFELIWMSVYIAIMIGLFFLIFMMHLFKRISDVEIMNFILNKLISIARAK